MYFDTFKSINTIGFEELFDKIQQTEKQTKGYPPYDIIRVSSDTVDVQIAVAGFSKEDLTVSLENSKLVVVGTRKQVTEKVDYIYKGIAERHFTRTFTVANTIEVSKCSLVDGILKITLVNVVPEEKKPKQFKIE